MGEIELQDYGMDVVRGKMRKGETEKNMARGGGEEAGGTVGRTADNKEA